MKRYHLNLKLTGVIVLIAVGVLLPVMLSTAVGIVALVIARDAGGIVTGVLVISFAAAAAGSALIAVVLAGSKAALARRQADFVANASHELRTPLSAIRLYAQTLRSADPANDPEQTAQCLDGIVRQTEWLDLLLGRVLTWRAASRDMMALTPKWAPVVPAVRAAVSRFSALAFPGEVDLSTSIDSERPVRHDAAAVTDVVLNLLTNAYKYTGREKKIGVSVRDADDGVTIEVTDNGIGLAPAEAKKVFLPFYRAEDAAEKGTSGVGLGLAIARDLVERQGGRMTVHSEKGKGSSFSVHLPMAVESS